MLGGLGHLLCRWGAGSHQEGSCRAGPRVKGSPDSGLSLEPAAPGIFSEARSILWSLQGTTGWVVSGATWPGPQACRGSIRSPVAPQVPFQASILLGPWLQLLAEHTAHSRCPATEWRYASLRGLCQICHPVHTCRHMCTHTHIHTGMQLPLSGLELGVLPSEG